MTELIQMERLMERFPVLEGCREEIWRAYEILKRTYKKKECFWCVGTEEAVQTANTLLESL